MKKRIRYTLLVDLPANGGCLFVQKGSTLTWDSQHEAYYFDHETDGDHRGGFWWFSPKEIRDTRFFSPIPV